MSTKAKSGDATESGTRPLLRSLSQARAAELIGKPAVWLRDHPEIGARNGDGTYDGPALVAAVLRRDSVRDLGDGELKRRRLEAECEKVEAEAQISKNKAGVEEGRLISMDEVSQAIAEISSAASEHLMAIPDKLAPRLPDDQRHELSAVIRADIARALDGYAEELERKVLGRHGGSM